MLFCSVGSLAGATGLFERPNIGKEGALAIVEALKDPRCQLKEIKCVPMHTAH